ncbi:AAA family ATPase [Limosilactobacillus difficilis]|uniref:AAA family ATPase n=1 Tax=Limosilactobacillus difficilis TaxID=2991838 RepID=UPI0024BA2074|nr:AAA family ATPase [Limosilactobacillus difficilis]
MKRDYFIDAAMVSDDAKNIRIALSYGNDSYGDYVFTSPAVDSEGNLAVDDEGKYFFTHFYPIDIETFNLLIKAIGRYPETMSRNCGNKFPINMNILKTMIQRYEADKDTHQLFLICQSDHMAFSADLNSFLVNDLKLQVSKSKKAAKVSKLKNDPKDSSIYVGSTEAYDKLNSLIGLKTVKQQVKSFINTANYSKKRKQNGFKGISYSYHSLFAGNPGTGKTTVARLVGRIMYEQGILPENKFKEVDRGGLVADYAGQTTTKTMSVLKEATGGVLFIDEAYSLISGNDDQFGREALDTIMKYMEDHRDNLMVIFAGYTKDLEKLMQANAGMKSRIPNVFTFTDYSPEEIVQIGKLELKNQEFSFENNEVERLYEDSIKNLYKHESDGSNGRWIRDENQKLIQTISSTDNHSFSKINETDIKTAFLSTKHNGSSVYVGSTEAYEKLNSLIGLKTVKMQVKNFINTANYSKKREQNGLKGISYSYHSLFAGNPGTGKTTVARLVGRIMYEQAILPDNKFKEVDRGGLVGQYMGQTTAKTMNVLKEATGGVLFIDEAYSLISGENDQYGQEALDTIMKYMEDHRNNLMVIFAGYTKDLEKLMQANAGMKSRIPNIFTFTDYSPEEIVRIGKLELKNQELNFENNETERLYENSIRDLYIHENDGSNGRWIRDENQKLIQTISSTDNHSFSKINEVDISKAFS